MRTFLMQLKRLKKSTPEKLFFEPIEVPKDKLNSIKLKNVRNEKFTTTIDKKTIYDD